MRVRGTLVVTLLALMVAGTVLMTHSAARYERQRAEARAQVAADAAAGAVEKAIASARTSLAVTAGLYDASELVTPDQFSVFADRVLGRDGLQALAWLERVPAGERAAWEARTGLVVTDPAPGGGLVPAAGRDVHFPVTTEESLLGGAVSLGLDPSAEPRRRQALRVAALADDMAATPPVPLFANGERGLLLYHPVYAGPTPATAAGRRTALRGFVAGAFRLGGLVATALRGTDPGIPVRIRDGDLPITATSLQVDAGESAGFGESAVVAVGGRRWTVVAGRPEPSSTLPLLIFACGMALTALTGVLASVMLRRDRFAATAVATATAELERSRRSLRALADNSPDVVARYDRDLRCTFVNDAITAATGLTPEQFVGRTSAEVGVPPALVATWEDAMRRCLSGETGVEVDFAFPTPVGTRFFHSRLAPEEGPSGGVATVLVVSRDVTRQVLAERGLRASEDRYRSLVEALPAGLVEQDGTGAIVSCNPAAEAILGLTAAQMAGRDSIDPRWRSVREDGSPYPGEDHPAMRTLRTGEPVDGDLLGVHRPDGDQVWLSVSSRLREDESGRSVVSCFTDVTARVEADREQAALRRVATAVAAHPDTAQVLELVAREAEELVGAQAAGVLRFDEGTSSVVVAGVHGDVPGIAEPGSRLDLAVPTAAARVAATGAVCRLEDGGDGHPNALIPDAVATTAVAAPIRVDNMLWGALSAVTTDPDVPLPPDAGARLARLADLVALAIMSSEARAQMATLASTDDLTGLPNRRSFTERLRGEIARARRQGTDLSLALLDVDHFKRINDTFGHPAGDRVLMGVAAHLFGGVREGEMVARIGGEEFAWILPDTDGAGAAAAAERMRRTLSAAHFDGVGALTVSVGVCQLGAGMDGPGLLRLADGALYRAKEAGRDRVVREIPADPVGAPGP